MTEPTTTQNTTTQSTGAQSTGGDDTESPESMLRRHVERASVQLRELESDMEGMLGDGGGTLQEDRDGTRRLIESVRSDLLRTQHALERIAAGTYGTCTACREPIAPARLQAIPEVERCSSCA